MCENNFEIIARKYTPGHVVVDFSKPPGYDRGRFYHSENPQRLQAPKPHDLESLWNYLHECAHATLHAEVNSREIPEYIREYEAEIWTQCRFHREGLTYEDGHQLSSEYLLSQIQAHYDEVAWNGIDRRIQAYLTASDWVVMQKSFDNWAKETGLTFDMLPDYRGKTTPNSRLFSLFASSAEEPEEWLRDSLKPNEPS